MDELTLDDLKNMSTDSNAIFDVFKQAQDGEPEATPKKDVVIKDPTKETTSSEDKAIASPESVATKDNQGKDGETTDDSSNSSSPQKVDNAKLFASLAAELKTKGVLPSLDLEKTEIKSLEDINKAMQAELDGRLDSKQKAISEAMKLGLDVNKTARQLETIERLKEIPEEFLTKEDNTDFRVQVITQDFKNKGYSEDRAKALAQRAVDAGADVEDARLALREVIKFEQDNYDQSFRDAQEKEEKELDDIKSFITKDEDIFPGIKLTPQQKDNIYAEMTTDLGNKENSFIQAQKQDPLKSRVKLEAIWHLTNGLEDFSMFGKKQVKEANNSFESLLRGSNFAETGDADFDNSDNTTYGTLTDLKDLTFE